MMRFLCKLVVLAAVLALPQWAAAGLSVSTGFEGNSVVAHDTWEDQAGGFATPVQALPDGWFEYNQSGVPIYDIQVTDNTTDPPGGAFAGQDCLRIHRSGSGSAVAMPFAKQTSGEVVATWWIRSPHITANALVYFTDNPTDNDHSYGLASSSARVLLSWEGSVAQGRPYAGLDSASGRDWWDFVWKPDVWEKWEMHANLDNNTWYLKIYSDGPRAVGGVWTSPTKTFCNDADISGLVFFGGNEGGSHLWIDDVTVTPEPATLALLALGGLAALRRRHA
jgi:hypothetical protein